jgi:hypothetical protein
MKVLFVKMSGKFPSSRQIEREKDERCFRIHDEYQKMSFILSRIIFIIQCEEEIEKEAKNYNEGIMGCVGFFGEFVTKSVT